MAIADSSRRPALLPRPPARFVLIVATVTGVGLSRSDAEWVKPG
jgi:hypothetical protein